MSRAGRPRIVWGRLEPQRCIVWAGDKSSCCHSDAELNPPSFLKGLICAELRPHRCVSGRVWERPSGHLRAGAIREGTWGRQCLPAGRVGAVQGPLCAVGLAAHLPGRGGLGPVGPLADPSRGEAQRGCELGQVRRRARGWRGGAAGGTDLSHLELSRQAAPSLPLPGPHSLDGPSGGTGGILKTQLALAAPSASFTRGRRTGSFVT